MVDDDNRRDDAQDLPSRDVAWRDPVFLSKARAWLVEGIVQGRVRATPRMQEMARDLLTKMQRPRSDPGPDQ